MSDHSTSSDRSDGGGELVDHLRGLGLTSLAKVVPGVLDTARQQQWSYEAFLEQALGVERQGRALRAHERRVRAAHLPASKSLESFDFSYQPFLSERLCRELAGLSFVATATNMVLLGPPDGGKPHPPLSFLSTPL